MTNSTNFQDHATVVEADWLNDVDRHVYDDYINIMNYGADNTGVALCNTALDLAKAAGRNGVGATVYFPPGVYRIENYSLDDLRIVGARASGSNVGANDCTVITGSGDLFVNANNFALEHLVIENTVAGTRGKLIAVADMDTKIGPIIDVDFRKATYHIYAGNVAMSIVSGQVDNCRFSDASVYSRYFLHSMNAYDEYNCYTTSNQRGLYVYQTSSMHLHGAASVFEYNEEGAIYIENTVSATDAIRSLCIEGIHFEANGQTTPTADITVNVTLGLARIKIDSCGFYLPTVAATAVVNLSSSPAVFLSHNNCTDIGITGLATTSRVVSFVAKVSGLTSAVYAQNASLYTNKQVYAGDGFQGASQSSATIDNSGSDNICALPTSEQARMVLINDSTTQGAAVVLLTSTTHTVVSNTLVSITLSASGGYLKGLVTGGASSRILYYTYLGT
jgi:hypothetical protein